MSRLTDLTTIARGMAAPLAWSRLSVVPKVTMHIEAAESIVFHLIYMEEEAIERERVIDEGYKRRLREWEARKPVKPWLEEREYADALRIWEGVKPVRVPREPVK